MNEHQETNSGAHGGAETSIAISTADMQWIKQTRGKLSSKARLHEVLILYRQQIVGEDV